MIEPFEDRRDAGRALAAALTDYKDTDAIVLAIPRGGVVVGYEIASALNLPLDIVVPRKIPAPGQEELAIGAVASWGDHGHIIDHRMVLMMGVSEEYIQHQVDRQLAEINRRLMAYRGSTNPPEVADRTVILVDDGIATGYTTRAAAITLRNLEAGRVILAVPVGPPDSVAAMRSYADEVVCLMTPSDFVAVGCWYRDFRQTTDEEVIELLNLARHKASPHKQE